MTRMPLALRFLRSPLPLRSGRFLLACAVGLALPLASTAQGLPEPALGCLTRSAGFWSNHPDIAEMFLPVTSCGLELTTANPSDLESAPSTTQDLCVNGNEAKRQEPPTSSEQLQLIRQCTTAHLNLSASSALSYPGEDTCAERFPDIVDTIADCCDGGVPQPVCTDEPSGPEIGDSGCIEALDAFNTSQDTFLETPEEFVEPGPANPRLCRAARHDGALNPRILGPRK